ncbi:hypothetical protein ACVWYH_001130 [Bradyrhizobium sp. GM24.11]
MAKATRQARVAASSVETGREQGAPAETATDGLYLPMFSIMPHRDRTACYAGLTEIDPIQVWINAERRLMGTQQISRGTVIPQLQRFNDATMSARRRDAQLSIRRLDIA